MELPNRDNAFVDPRKVRDYLLCYDHPVGRWKARFFASVGFPPAEWRRFIAALEKLARDGDVVFVKETAFGHKYVVKGTIAGRGTPPAEVESVWLVPADNDAPRLVTVYPT